MQGLEVVLVRLASTVLSTVTKSLVTPRPGAGLVSDPVRQLPKPASPEKLARVLSGRIAASYDSLPEHERMAAVAAVQGSFGAAGLLDAERLFAMDLDPGRLTSELRRPVTDLTERAGNLYEELLGLCCAHVVEQLTAHPSFTARAAVEQTRRTGALLRAQEGRRPGTLGFEARYAAYMDRMHARLELFGITLGGPRRAEWPLDTAYLSLAVSGRRPYEPHREGMDSLTSTTGTVVRAEQALAGCARMLLRGPAGSGKSTLLQWLALNAARQTFGPELADWNRCVPFTLRLRSFHERDELPLPEDFLSASGVPLRAPERWAEQLLGSGRALVLVDGVDEVPPRLRGRTETWLRSLVTAFPRARYVVTTRPSAVPEDWLATQGFDAHALLPMARDDIKAFLRHWHDAARLECVPAAEQERLDQYEAGLGEAVATRRDLGRLATNPLMCALLCALNRDRHMHLPRARKELYDAALDMLLVRRDTEREIPSVEGIVLSRDEQTALLQRLAYWLIRNGQVEASRDDVVGMLDEWLRAMPQVREQGGAEQVYTHLLIRSGLLREPVPGYVDFVHRTFQDYLGAKAAVEARDFGVLVRNAHDDQWDDVVRMGVGHARPEERGRLLRQLLRRADRTQRHRERLVLLAAASLEHAPELDPSVRREVEKRTARLMPPRSSGQADSLAKVGELVLELLPGPDGLSEPEAAAVVRTAGLIGGEAALAVISRFREDQRFSVRVALDSAWPRFDTVTYFDAVLDGTVPDGHPTTMSGPEQLALLPRLPQLSNLVLEGDQGIPDTVLGHSATRFLQFRANDSLSDLTPLRRLPRLSALLIDRCPGIRDLSALSVLPSLERVFVFHPAKRLSLAPLGDLPALRQLTLDFRAVETSLAELRFAPQLTGLRFYRQAAAMKLTGLEALTSLRELAVNEDHQWRDFLAAGVFSPLVFLLILDVRQVDLAALSPYQELDDLYLRKVDQVDGVAALADLPALQHVEFNECGPLDLTPLASVDRLKVTLWECHEVTGADLFPADRLVMR